MKTVTPTKEIEYQAASGVPMLILGLALTPLLIGIPILCGLTLVNPNKSKIVLLFGEYLGTIRQPGLWWVNPLSVRKDVSLRVNNFNSEKLKVNDLRGNPVEIGTVVVWRVSNTAQASFDVQDYESYVAVQTESALRTTAAKHPYDSALEGQTSLRGDSEEINLELQQELTERLSLAGIEVLEVRLSHLAYASEIAGAMLRRQQAEAIIDARARIVEGAVSMVEMALDHLEDGEIITMNNDQKAAMVSNLMIVLCSESETNPVINAGHAA
ncbi:MAG: SPFH domain-containing protein [Mariniblastus sp.]